MKINKKINKKNLIIISLIILFSLVSFIIIMMNNNDKREYLKFSKYEMRVTILSTDKNGQTKNIDYTVKSDGVNASIYSTGSFNERIYILKNGKNSNIVYKKNEKYLMYSTKNSLMNCYDIMSSFKNEKEQLKNENIEILNVKVDKKNINDILKNMFLNISVSGDVDASIIVKDNYVTTFNFFLEGIGEYENLNITFTIEALQETFEVLIPSLDKDKREWTDLNFFESLYK